MCPFDYTAVAGSGKVGPVNQVNHTSWVAEVTPTDRPKSVRNRCVIELFVALFMVSLCPFDVSAGVRAFVIGLSQIFFFFLLPFFHWFNTNQSVRLMRHNDITLSVHVYQKRYCNKYPDTVIICLVSESEFVAQRHMIIGCLRNWETLAWSSVYRMTP